MDSLIDSHEILKLFKNTIGYVFCIILIFEGTKRIFLKPRRRYSFLLLSLGISYVVIFSTAYFHYANKFEKVSRPSDKFSLNPNIPEDWRAESPPDERESYSKIMARFYYKETGSLINYVDQTGTWRPYCPTDDDVKMRDVNIEYKFKLKNLENSYRKAAWNLIITAIFSALFGFLASRKMI